MEERKRHSREIRNQELQETMDRLSYADDMMMKANLGDLENLKRVTRILHKELVLAIEIINEFGLEKSKATGSKN